MPWLGHRGRFLVGAEALRMMGMWFETEDRLVEFPARLLRNLAGNAFDSASFLAAWVTLQLFLARLHRLSSERAASKSARDTEANTDADASAPSALRRGISSSWVDDRVSEASGEA